MDEAAGLKVRKGASRSKDPGVAARELYEAVYDPEAALTVFYCSPEYDLEVLGPALHALFGDAPLIGCTTAGEISPLGYLEGSLTGVSIGGKDLRAASVRLDDLKNFELHQGDAFAAAAMARLGKGAPKAVNADACFGFLLVDGLSMQEEGLVSSIYRNLGAIPLFGGSAGDGTRFGRTFLYHEGAFRSDCAVFTLVESAFPFLVFKTEHFVASPHKMVVTKSDAARRIVTEINGEPAAVEYARAVGLAVTELTPLSFATHPVVVSLSGQIFVRSIQKVNDDGSLTFFCAIDEGIVLTVAQGVDMVQNLSDAFDRVKRAIGQPGIILGCDCILRFIETGQKGSRERIGALMVANNVIGFSTYGEQYNAMHVNQTFTGVAIGSAHAGV
jgi:hypothetical protein